MQLPRPEEGAALLSGPLPSQTVLPDLPERIRDLNLTMITVTRGGTSARYVDKG